MGNVEVEVFWLELPDKVRGAVTKDKSMKYTVWINTKLSEDQQIKECDIIIHNIIKQK